MTIQSMKQVFFSPTGTTRSIVQGIATGIQAVETELYDITLPEGRAHPLRASENSLVVIGVPVYMGRVPALIGKWLGAMDLGGSPVVCVVVYGNRAYENALLELKDIVKARGGIPVAGGAYIGEHSFSDTLAPTAQGRPDADDLAHAEEFGRKVTEKMRSVVFNPHTAEVEVPGSYPYEGVTELWDVDFIAVNEGCIQCGLCAEVCPMGAVDPDDSSAIDIGKCITCCACIKQCPQGARVMKAGPVKDAQKRLNSLFSEPKQPEYYL